MMEHVDAMVAALYMQRQSVMCILQSRLKQTVQDQKARKQSMQAEGRSEKATGCCAVHTHKTAFV